MNEHNISFNRGIYCLKETMKQNMW